MKLRILLTGGSGYIGKNIQEIIGSKYHFFAPAHSDLELTDGTQVDTFFKTYPIDLVIHAANIGGDRKHADYTDVVKTNLRIFFNLLKNRRFFKKMIFFGSGAEYDKSKPLVRVKEENFGQRIPLDDYGFYKYVCSRFLESQTSIVNLRIFGIYGKYEDYSQRFISNNICRVLLDKPIKMRQNVYFDYVYINDFVKIVEYFINNPAKYKYYNVGRGERIDLKTIAKTILRISGKKLPIVVDKSGLANEYTCDTTRLRKEMPDLKFTPFTDSVTELFAYYKKLLPSLKKDDLTKYD